MRNYAAIVTGLLLISLAGNYYFISLNREANERSISANRQSQERIARKQAEILSRDSVIKAIKDKVDKDSAKFKVAVMAYNEEIKGYKKTIARLRPTVQAKIDSFPDLRAFVAAQDSVITHQDSLIRHQDVFCTAQVRSLNEIIALTNQQYESQKLITSEVTSQLAEVDAQMRKERRGKRFFQWTAGIVTGIALFIAVKQD